MDRLVTVIRSYITDELTTKTYGVSSFNCIRSRNISHHFSLCDVLKSPSSHHHEDQSAMNFEIYGV